MMPKPKSKGSWGMRFFITMLSIVLGILLYWLLSFIENDIGTMSGPDYASVRREFVDASYDVKKRELSKETETLNRRIKTVTEQQRLLSSSTNNLQGTISQLLDIQRESLTRNVEFPEESRKTLQESQSQFLKNQQEFQQLNQEISQLTSQNRQKEEELAAVTEDINSLEKQVSEEFGKLSEKHRWKVAAVKLAFLVPVFIVLSIVFMKYRTGVYWPLVWAGFLSAFIKITMVVHEYFPSRYFNYIAILVLLAIVLRILLGLIRMIAAPKKDMLVKQYQQDYDKCVCPICSKPIRTGLLRYAGGLKKKSVLLNGVDGKSLEQESYTCPSCGTALYDKCDGCGGVRHNLLPYCEHCGKEKMTSPAN